MKVAIAHDYLTQRGGAERVVLALCRTFPDAVVHTSLYDPEGTFPGFRDHQVETLWLDRAPPLRKRHRLALPLLPIAWASSKIAADVVICSSSGWAHGVRTSGRKIVYCHSPAKWLYRPDDYLGARPGRGARLAAGLLTPPLRVFDHWAARSAETYVANSSYIAMQVRSVYGIEATVVPPPAGLSPDGLVEPDDRLGPGFVLTVARLLPYKNVGPTIEAVRDRGDRLVVVGDGPQRTWLSRQAPPNVTLLGEVDDARLRWLYANCSILVAASREDFGLTPIEAGCFGKPVAALRWGGFLDTVVPGTSGVFFEQATPVAIRGALDEVAKGRWDADAIRRHAETFSEEQFAERMRAVVGLE